MRRGSRTIPDEIKEAIFNMHQENKYSQKRIAAKFGVAHGSITNIVNQYKNRPQLDDIEKVLDIDKLQNGRPRGRISSLEERLERIETSLEARVQKIEDELGFV